MIVERPAQEGISGNIEAQNLWAQKSCWVKTKEVVKYMALAWFCPWQFSDGSSVRQEMIRKINTENQNDEGHWICKYKVSAITGVLLMGALYGTIKPLMQMSLKHSLGLGLPALLGMAYTTAMSFVGAIVAQRGLEEARNRVYEILIENQS